MRSDDVDPLSSFIQQIYERHNKLGCCNELVKMSWKSSLGHISINLIENAVIQHYKTSKFIPTEKDILDIISPRMTDNKRFNPQNNQAWTRKDEEKYQLLCKKHLEALQAQDYDLILKYRSELMSLDIPRSAAGYTHDKNQIEKNKTKEELSKIISDTLKNGG